MQCAEFILTLLFVFLFLCISPAPVRAQTATTLLQAGSLLDVRSGKLLSDQAILIVGDKIAEVGPAVEISKHAPATAVRIQLSGLTLLPGMIDCHAHVLGNLEDLSATGQLRMSSAQLALWGYHNLQIWLEHGFTTLRDAAEADLSYAQFALRDSIKMGLIRGPRMVSAGNYISVTGGHGDADVLSVDNALPRRPNLTDSVADVGPAVRHDIKYGADWVKLIATGGISDPISDFNVQEMSEEQMREAVAVAHRAHKKVMAHAEGADGIKAAVRAGVDSIEHGTMLDEEGASLMAKNGTWLVPTVSVFQRYTQIGSESGLDPVALEKSRTIIRYLSAAFQNALKYKVKIAFGLDDEPRFLPRELPAMVGEGLKPMEALQAATINAAELLGMSDQIGTIEKGKFADIIAVSGDPTKDIGVMSNVLFVMKGGEVIKQPK
jgi:imidazolonepropionase-like amidohydrolase